MFCIVAAAVEQLEDIRKFKQGDTLVYKGSSVSLCGELGWIVGVAQIIHNDYTLLKAALVKSDYHC